MRNPSGVQYLFTDQLGSTRAWSNGTGTVYGSQRYKPWGETDNASGSTASTDYLFTGQRDLASLGIYDYQARYYDPLLGRFLQPDSIIPNAYNPMSWDRYAYVNNNATNFNDPSGHTACEGAVTCEIGQDTEKVNNNYWRHDYGESETYYPTAKMISTPEQSPAQKIMGDLSFYKDLYGLGGTIEGGLVYGSNYLRPAWRHVRGVLPGGVYEGIASAALQFGNDLANPNANFTWWQYGLRAVVVGGEDVIIDADANLIGGLTGAVGGTIGGLLTAGTGVGVAVGTDVGATFGFIAGSYITTQRAEVGREAFNKETVNKIVPGLFP